MPGKARDDLNKDEAASSLSPIRKGARFLIDQDLALCVRDFLCEQGWDAVSVHDLGVDGDDDEAVFATAWQEDRWLVTGDVAFLDNARFPFSRNPGLIVFGCDTADAWRLCTCLSYVFWLFGPHPDIYREAKIIISNEGDFEILFDPAAVR